MPGLVSTLPSRSRCLKMATSDLPLRCPGGSLRSSTRALRGRATLRAEGRGRGRYLGVGKREVRVFSWIDAEAMDLASKCA